MLRAANFGTSFIIPSTYKAPLATTCQSIAQDALVLDKNYAPTDFTKNQHQANIHLNRQGERNGVHRVTENDPHILINLLEHLLNQDLQDSHGRTPLHLAAESGDLKLVIALVERHAKIDVPDADNAIPLHLAIKNNHTEVAKVLIKAHIDTNTSLASKIKTLFRFAASWGNSEVMEALIEAGAQINLGNWENQTLLHLAAMSGDIQMAKALLDCGAKIDLLDANNATPLLLALKNYSTGVVRILLTAYIQTNTPFGSQGMELLRVAAEQGSSKIIETLKKAGLNINMKDSEGNTLLHNASISGDVRLVRTLLKCGAEINPLNKEEATPLHNATICGHTSIATLLLNHGANKDAALPDGRTPLFLASQYHRVEILEALIDGKTKINSQDKLDWNLLHIAAKKRFINTRQQNEKTIKIAEEKAKENCIKTVNVLLEANRNRALAGNQKIALLETANKSGYVEIKALIEKAIKESQGRQTYLKIWQSYLQSWFSFI